MRQKSSQEKTNVSHVPRVSKTKKEPGPSRRFKNHPNTLLKDGKSNGLSKKAMRRLRQKIKKNGESENTTVEDLKKEVDLLKVMKRLNNGSITNGAKHKKESNVARQGKLVP